MVLGMVKLDGNGADLLQRVNVRAPRPTASTMILADLRNAILDVSLLPGTPLSEKALIERYGTSRTPVREALIKLSQEGLVEIIPQSGTFVGRIPLAELPEAVVVRQALEVAAVRYAIASAQSADIALLAQAIVEQKAFAERGDRVGYHAADERFHEILSQVAKHPALWRMAAGVKVQIDRCRRLTLPVAGRMDIVIREHRAILDAISMRDEARAVAAMTAHLAAVIPDATALSAEFPGYFQ